MQVGCRAKSGLQMSVGQDGKEAETRRICTNELVHAFNWQVKKFGVPDAE